MASPLADVCRASLPVDALPQLADVRTVAGIRVMILDERAWVRWDAGDEEVLRRILPIQGAEVFELRDGQWYRPGQRLPAFNLPEEKGARPLSAVLTPSPVEAQRVHPTAFERVRLVLVRDEKPRAATALRCSLEDLARWADGATSRQLTALEAAWYGDSVLLLGQRLPALAGCERFWGRTVLVPLGFRPEPVLPESALRQALGLQEEEIAVLGHGETEVVAREAFQTLTRAAARRAGSSPLAPATGVRGRG
jgi:hypothetical protein